ncbi:ferrous iron transport protein A [Streptomyces sp. NPDC002690]
MEDGFRSLPAGWPERAWAPGTRVRVVQSPDWAGPWPAEFCGTVDDLFPPEAVDHPQAEDGELAYWVRFDHSQMDSEGCGPYHKAQIWGSCLRAEQG